MAQIGQKPSWWSLPGKLPLLLPAGGADVLFLLHLRLRNRGNFLSPLFPHLSHSISRKNIKAHLLRISGSNFPPAKISSPFKRGLQRRMVWSISSSSAGLRFCDLWYSLEPLLLLKTRCSTSTSAASEIVSYKELVTLFKSLAEAYEDTGEVPICYVLSRANIHHVSYPIVSASHHSFRDNNSVNREVKATEFKLNWWNWDEDSS